MMMDYDGVVSADVAVRRPRPAPVGISRRDPVRAPPGGAW